MKQTTEFDDLKAQVEALGEKLKDMATDATETITEEVSARTEAAAKTAKEKLAEGKKVAAEKAQEANAFVKEKPWHAVGIAAGIGALFGLLLRKKK